MKHGLYKLADQYHLNANEQQLLQAVLETAKKRRSVQRAGVCSAELHLPGSRDPSDQVYCLDRLLILG